MLMRILLLALLLGATACTANAPSVATVREDTSVLPVPPASPLAPPVTATQPESPLGPTLGILDIVTSPDGQQIQVRLASIYSGLPDYTVWYEAAVWQLGDDGITPILTLRDDSACRLWLKGAARGAARLGMVNLGDREWAIYEGGINEQGRSGFSVGYSIRYDKGGYLFDIGLPARYQAEKKSQCELLAEAVIATFALVSQPAEQAGGTALPTPTAAPALGGRADWLLYAHPVWGIRFRHPADWTVSIPNLEALASGGQLSGAGVAGLSPEQMEAVRTLGHQITLTPLDEAKWGEAKVEIGLAVYTLSPQGSLVEWVTLLHGWNENTGGPVDSFQSQPLAAGLVPAGVDQAVRSLVEHGGVRIETIWLARDGLVFGVHAYESSAVVATLQEQIAVTMEFIPAQLAELRARAPFAGDEEAIRAFNAEMSAPAASP